LKIFRQTLIFYFQSDHDFLFSIVITIPIENRIRMDRTLIFIFSIKA